MGMKSGTIIISSDGQGTAGGDVEIPVAYEVLGELPCDYNNNGLVDQADLDLVLSSWGKPFDEIPATWSCGMPTEGIVRQEELDVVLT